MANELILPGLIESNAHFRGGKKQGHIENPTTGTKAALASGITLSMFTPDTDPLINSPRRLAMAKAEMEGNIYGDTVPIYLADGENYETLAIVAPDVAAVEIFLTRSTEDHKVQEQIWDKTWEHMPADKPLIVHDVSDLKKALQLTRRHKTKVHFAHVYSTAQVDAIRRAQAAGLNVTCEVTDHHLAKFSDAEIVRLGSRLKTLPAIIFDPNNRAALWDGIYDGTITMFGGDHAPHTQEEKAGFTEERGPFGVPTLDTSLGMKTTWVAKEKLSPEQLVDMMYYNPKRIFNLPDQPGSDVLVDMDEKWIVRKKGLQTKCHWSQYEGRVFTGRAKRTRFRGQTAYFSGDVIGKPIGQVLRPLAA